MKHHKPITPLLWQKDGAFHQNLSSLFNLEAGYNKNESENLVGARTDDDVIKNFQCVMQIQSKALSPI